MFILIDIYHINQVNPESGNRDFRLVEAEGARALFDYIRHSRDQHAGRCAVVYHHIRSMSQIYGVHSEGLAGLSLAMNV